jgi:hypothetical protein
MYISEPEDIIAAQEHMRELLELPIKVRSVKQHLEKTQTLPANEEEQETGDS